MRRIVGGTYKLNNGHEFPLIGFGTFQIKGQEAISISIDAALDAGYRLIDTAKYYQNEEEIGNALHELLPKYHLKRSDLFITTKVILVTENQAQHVRDDIAESLRFLQTDYLDLVLIHYPRPWTEKAKDDDSKNAIYRKEAYLELQKLSREGKIKSIGVSNYESRHIAELMKYATIPPAVNQCEFHPHFTRNELRSYCKRQDIFFQAFTSLARNEPTLFNDPVLVGVAKKYKMPVTLILLAYAHLQGIGIIPKSVTPSRIQDNLGVVDVKLTDEEIAKLTALNRNQNYTLCTGWKVS